MKKRKKSMLVTQFSGTCKKSQCNQCDCVFISVDDQHISIALVLIYPTRGPQNFENPTSSMLMPWYAYLTYVKSLLVITVAPIIKRQPLTHWGRGKMAAVSQTTLSNTFLERKCYNFNQNVTEICSYLSYEQYFSIGSDNGLAPTRRQAIMWTNES